MSNSDFVKGACRHCAGHLEFPANAAGQTVPCPHCGRPTVLVPGISPNKHAGSRRIWPGIILGGCLVAAGVAGAFFYLQSHQGANPESKPAPAAVPATNSSVVATPIPAPPPKPRSLETTNDFAIMPFKLEKTAGSSLVYVVGTVQNLSDQQRFGVKVQFSLFDTNDIPVGSATDYQSVIDPHGEWRFKALVMESKAAAARFAAIVEEK
jgi:hypothetical protein